MDLNVGYYRMVIDENGSGSYSMSVYIWSLNHVMVNTLWWIYLMDVVILNTWMLERLDVMIEYTLDGNFFVWFYTGNLSIGCFGS